MRVAYLLPSTKNTYTEPCWPLQYLIFFRDFYTLLTGEKIAVVLEEYIASNFRFSKWQGRRTALFRKFGKYLPFWTS